jgi:hypothetical protein
MNSRFSFLILFVLPLVSCDENTANVTIPAGEEFVLGEQAATDYSAELTNLGEVEIKISVRSKESGEQTQGFGLPAGSDAEVNISTSERVYLLNDSEREAQVFVVLSESVEGMRYQPIE